jgi:ABC-type dipeptide/oligopeptide/nickel transport system permease component
MTTARAKGIRGRLVLLRHGFKNALIPIITIIGLTLPDLVAGAVITESLFGWPGMGQLAVKAATGRDFSLMMGVILVVATGRADREPRDRHPVRRRRPARAPGRQVVGVSGRP